MANDECEQYVFEAIGHRPNRKTAEHLQVFESPLAHGDGTLFMVLTAKGEERASFVSPKTLWPARIDFRKHVRGIKINRMGTLPIHERAGPKLALAS